ncbi:uncharacterized protein LOC134717940 [Mytilus trossulus]|uniref:uncharacterized protein LOC134717940 n=1 Tax=Mytilus trossulus TaxID=6551 RepID=UPI003005B72D
MDDVCDADAIECQKPQISKPGEIIYGQCYRQAAIRRLPKALVGKCSGHVCSEGYKCVLNGDELACEIAYCIGKPRLVENAVLDEPFGLSRDLGHGMMYKCADGIQISGKPFAVCRNTGIWTSLFVCGEGPLVSKFKATGQSTTLQDYPPGHGVDGIKEPSNMFHTLLEFEPYWWVDLGRVYKIQKVISTNRIGCDVCGVRLRKMLIHVGDSLDTSNMELCGQFIGQAVKEQIIVTQCSSLPEGQKVRLTSINNALQFFHLAEVEVYGFYV